MKKKYTIETGKIYGDLRCIRSRKVRQKSGNTATVYLMKCTKCGREKEMLGPTIAHGKGINHSACGKGLKTKDTDFYARWQAMRTRTTNPNYEHADRYGDRGINSDEFRYFIDFYDAMYESFCVAVQEYGEHNASLERVDIDGNYCRDNCIWVPKDMQQGNTNRTVYFIATFPDGHKECHRDAMRFAKAHDLSTTCVHDCINGKLRSYKGYRFTRLQNSKSVTTIESEDEQSRK